MKIWNMKKVVHFLGFLSKNLIFFKMERKINIQNTLSENQCKK